MELLSYIKIEEKYEDEEILDANGLIEKQEIGLEADVRIDIEDIYHHTYQEEVKTMDYIREGNLEEVVGAVELLASTAGKLSENEIRKEIWGFVRLRWQQEQQSKVGQFLPKRISSVIFISIR